MNQRLFMVIAQFVGLIAFICLGGDLLFLLNGLK